MFYFLCILPLTSVGIDEDTGNEKQSTAGTEEKLTNEVVAVGEIGSNQLKRMPLTLSVNLESMEGVALLDRGAR